MSGTLIDAAADQFEQRAYHPAMTFVRGDGGEITHNYYTFFHEAADYAAALENAGIASGDLVVLVMEQSIEVMAAFWGALLIGAIPSIFPFLNEKLDADHYFTSIRQLIGFEGVRAIITFQKFEADLRAALAGLDMELITAETLNARGDPAAYFARPLPAPAATAFLQHSSGSTGLQKGVMLSHRAALNQIEQYADVVRVQRGWSVIASWLPLYHDMGLIAAFLLPITIGAHLVIMSPFEWVRQPAMLLHAIKRHYATHVWLPNFAYNFMATRIRDAALQGVDLSSLAYVINCSEPVYAESHRVFVQKFAPYGLKESALRVCYAMAENTFAVTQTPHKTAPRIDFVDRRRFAEDKIAVPADGDAPRMEIVSCGAPIPNTEVRIAGADGAILPERHIGEIELRSDCMLTGYYKRDDLNPFHDGWLMTGDMGYLADGELYVTGRKKDLIIVAGKNVYPQDIENLLNDVSGVYPGRVVAFGVPNAQLGTEDVAVLVEAETEALLDDDERRGEIVRDVRARIAADTEVTARYVEVLPPRHLIKTSSGKIARTANRERFLERLSDG
jgi:fatty-acyl-CoA synthase